MDNDIARHCAFSLPAVALTLGRANWPLLKVLGGKGQEAGEGGGRGRRRQGREGEGEGRGRRWQEKGPGFRRRQLVSNDPNYFQETYESLANDMQWKVDCNYIACLHFNNWAEITPW